MQAAHDIACPLEGLPWRATSHIALRVHFMHRHTRDTVVIMEEGSHTLTFCPKCDIFVPWQDLDGKHQATDMCSRGEERKRE